MPKSFCEEVVMATTEEMLTSRDPGVSDIHIHLENCEACREAVSRKIAVQRLAGQVNIDPIASRRMAVKILASQRSVSKKSGYRWWVAVPAAAAVALAVLVLVYPSQTPMMENKEQLAVESHDVPESLEKLSPTVSVLKQIALKGEADTIVMAQGAKVWMQSETHVDILADTELSARMRVNIGRIIVDINKRTPGFEFVVETPSATVTSLGTIFSVEVEEDGSETIRVSKSAVVVRPLGERDPMVVRAGEELVLGGADTQNADNATIEQDVCLVQGTCSVDYVEAPTHSERHSRRGEKRRTPKNTKARYNSMMTEKIDNALWDGRLKEAESLLLNWNVSFGDGRFRRFIKLASAYRKNRRFKEAVHVYERLYGLFPDRDGAVNGLVSIAQIKQSYLKDAAGAVHYYDRYIEKRPSGVLAEAAAAGKVRALYNLRHWREVVDASDQYMQLYAGGPSEKEVLQKRRQASEKLER